MPSTTKFLAGALLAGVAAANPLTTLAVCPGADPVVPACTVTSQHQVVSTCSPVASTCAPKVTGAWTSGHKNATASCSTSYSYSSYAWVSTVIPCAWNGKSMSSCTVTKTQQTVPCSVSVTTSTSSTPTKTNYITKTFTATGYPHTTSISVSTSIGYSTSYQTVSKVWNAPYAQLGPHAIPGYPGSGLDQDDTNQSYDVSSCESSDGKAPSCSQYPENHPYPKSGPSTSISATATNSVKTSVPSAGSYTFTFTNSAPSAVITSGGQAYTQPPHPWFNTITTSVDGGNVDFTVTVTRTITVPWPGKPSQGSPSSVPASAAQQGWGNWNAPSQPTSGSDPSGSSNNNQGWGNWGNNGGNNGGNNWGNNGGQAAPTGGLSDGNQGWGNWGNNGGQAAPTGGSQWGGDGSFPGFPGAPGTGTFPIPVDSSSGSKYSTSGNQWIGFPNGGDDASVVNNQGGAAQFYWDSDGNLMCNGQYVYTDTSSGYLVFELGPNKPSGPKFSVGPDGSFGLPGAGFCATDSTFFITFGGSPNGCKPVTCPLGPKPTSSGWGSWPTSSFVTKTTSSPTPDPSADWNDWSQEKPQETGASWKRSGLRFRVAN